MTFSKIEAIPLSSRIATTLRDAILANDIKGGEELSLTDIASKFGVSRTPVREAFQILALDGFLSLRMNKTAIAKGVDEQFLINHYEIRMVLEGRAAMDAAQCDDNFEDLVKLQDKAENTYPMSMDEYRQYNRVFHSRIWTSGKNDRLRQMLNDLWVSASVGNLQSIEEYQKNAISEHREILKCLTEHNPSGAMSGMEKHIATSLDNMLKNMRIRNNTDQQK